MEEEFTVMDKLFTLHEHTILCGDFNFDLLIMECNQLCDLIASVELRLINSWPTRYASSCKPALLDLLCVSDTCSLVRYDQFPLGRISDHEFVFLALNIQVHSKKQLPTFSYRDMKLVN